MPRKRRRREPRKQERAAVRGPRTPAPRPEMLSFLTDTRWGAGLLLALATLVFAGAVHGFDGIELDKGYDWFENFSFQRDFVSEAWERGEFPLWCPYTFGGRPFYADPQTQVFYPPIVLWLFLPKMAAYTADVLIHYFLAAWFACLFARSLDVRAGFAVLAGILFSFAGFNVNHTVAGHVNFHAAYAWIPLVFLCIERAVRGRATYWFWGAAVLGLQFLAGSIPVSWMTFLFAGLYGAVRAAVPFEPARLARGVAGLAVTITLGAGLSAIQLIPTAEFASESVRRDNSYEYSIHQDLPPRNLVNMIFPHGQITGPSLPKEQRLIPEGEFNGYIGIAPIGLGLMGLALVRRRAVPALVAVFLLAVPLMLGDATPLFRILWTIVPGVSTLRFHSREILMMSFALAAAGAIALEALAQRTESRMRAPAVERAFWFGTGSLLLAAAASYSYLAGNPTAPWWQIAIVLLSLGALWVARRRSASPAFALGLILLVLADLTVNAVHFNTRYTQIRAPAPKMEETLGRVLRDDGGLFRAHFHKRAYRRERFIADRFPTVDGYEALIPRRWYELIHVLGDAEIRSVLVAEASQYILENRATTFPYRILNVKYTTVREDGSRHRLVENPDPAPRAWLASEAVVESDDARATALLKSAAFDPRHTAIIAEAPEDTSGSAEGEPGSGPPVRAAPHPASLRDAPPATIDAAARTLSADGRVSTTEAGRVEITDWALNSIRLRTSAPAPAFLVLSEGWYPGWRATVDGRPVPVVRTHVTLRGLAVPAGDNEVVFRFRPAPLRTGAAVTALALALWGAGLSGLLLLARRRNGPGDDGGGSGAGESGTDEVPRP